MLSEFEQWNSWLPLLTVTDIMKCSWENRQKVLGKSLCKAAFHRESSHVVVVLECLEVMWKSLFQLCRVVLLLYTTGRCFFQLSPPHGVLSFWGAGAMFIHGTAGSHSQHYFLTRGHIHNIDVCEIDCCEYESNILLMPTCRCLGYVFCWPWFLIFADYVLMAVWLVDERILVIVESSIEWYMPVTSPGQQGFFWKSARFISLKLVLLQRWMNLTVDVHLAWFVLVYGSATVKIQFTYLVCG